MVLNYFRKMTKLRCFNQDNPHFSAFERHAKLSELPGFIEQNQWTPNSPDLNPLNYHVWGTMLEKYRSLRRLMS